MSYIVVEKNKYSHIVVFEDWKRLQKIYHSDVLPWLKENTKGWSKRGCYLGYGKKISYDDYRKKSRWWQWHFNKDIHNGVNRIEDFYDNPYQYGVQIAFLDEEDAALFKLTWG